MVVRFDETPRGRKFYERDLPKLIKAIEENTLELKRANDLKEKELKICKKSNQHSSILDYIQSIQMQGKRGCEEDEDNER